MEACQPLGVASPWGLDSAHMDGDRAFDCAEQVLKQMDGPWGLDVAPVGLQQPWSAGYAPQSETAEAAASLALAVAAMRESGVLAPTVAEKTASAMVLNPAAMASPLRVPLPEPMMVQSATKQDVGFELDIHELPEPQKIEATASESALTEPQKLAAPPGLLPRSGPGAALTESLPSPIAAAAVTRSIPQETAVTPQGMTIGPGEVGGRACTRVSWKIDDFSGKLQASMGRPVVSPAFDAGGLSNLRLMVFPDARDAVKSARSHQRKGLYAAMVKKGPLYGSLKLKADGLERGTIITFALTVGSTRAGPSTYDFSAQAVCGLDDFGVDWLQQVDRASGALDVGIEIVEVRRK